MSGRVRVLVVTGKASGPLSRSASALATKAPYDVDQVSDLASGLGHFAARRPSVTVLQVCVPDSRGLHKFRRFQSQSGDVPIIVVGASTNPRAIIELVHAGAADYLLEADLTASVLERSVVEAVEFAGRARKRTELEQIRADFVATASHELRTPLSIIREYVSIVHDGIVGPLNDEQRDCLDSARRNCDRLADLIDGTLDLRRLETGTQRVRRQRTEPASILRPCARDFEPQVRKKHQTLRVEVADGLPDILGSASALTQVVVNLLGNATKFTPDGGEIVLRGFPKGEHIRVEVEDTGVGISSADQERIFEKFARAGDNSVLGTGLGLAISRQLVEVHEGAIGVRSTAGEGSTFWFTIPRYTERRELEAFIGDAAQFPRDDNERRLSVTLVRPHVSPTGEGTRRSRLLKALRTIEHAISGTLRRRGDATLLVERMGLVAIAAEVEDEGIEALRERIERTVLQSVGTTIPISFASAVADRERSTEALLSGLEAALGSPPGSVRATSVATPAVALSASPA